MRRALVQWGGLAAAVSLALLAAAPVSAADQSGVRPVAEELGQRTKPAAAAPEGEQKSGGLSDIAVRVLMTYALSIIPESYPGPDGKPVKVDKTNPNKFVIPVDDARRVVRAATRSAYADVCGLTDLERANFQALMRSEEAKKVWSKDQMLMISALHMFSVSYFTGNIKITTSTVPDDAAAKPKAEGSGAVPVSKDEKPSAPEGAEAQAQGGDTQVLTPKHPTCSPEQKVKVTNAINAFVAANPVAEADPKAAQAPQGAKPPQAQAAPPPATATGSN